MGWQKQSGLTKSSLQPHRSWWRLRLVSALVLACLTLGSAAASIAVFRVAHQQERRLLGERASDVELVLNNIFSSVQSNMQALAAVASATNGDAEKFALYSAPLTANASQQTSLVLLDRVNNQEVVKNRVGVGPVVEGRLNADAESAVIRSRATKKMEPTPAFDVDGVRRIGFALFTPTLGPDAVLYYEVSLQPVGTVSEVQSNAFSDIRLVLYAGRSADPTQSIITTSREMPLSHNVVSRELFVGGQPWLLQVKPQRPLLGDITQNIQWYVLAGGLVITLLLTGMLEVISRRRDDALALVDERSKETEAILDAAKDAFIAIDETGHVLRWNRQATDLFGWRTDEVAGRKLRDTIIPPEMRDAHDQGMERFLATGDARILNTRIEVEAMHRDGRRFPIELAIWAIENEGRYIFNAFLHDITKRRKAADELARAHEQALEASRLKSEFLANMSHEIRTPMNGVIGMTGLLLRTDLNQEQREYAETVRASADALLNVINDILDFSKIEAGKLELEVVDFELRGTVEEVGELLADAAHSKNLELIINVEAPVPTMLRGDPGRLRQILLNLVGNAVKFTNEGEVVLSCTVANMDDRETELRFEVQDTGVGISPIDRERIFESFTQVDASSTKRYEGTGLGLAIVKQLTTLMNGEVGVESELGNGSTFWFTAHFTNSSTVPLDGDTYSTALDGVRVLIVDDNSTNTQILSSTVTEWGMRPSTAGSAIEGLSEMEAAVQAGDPYKVALLDYHMPETDGLALAQRISADPRFQGTKMLLLTSSGDRSEQTGIIDAGVTAALTKPVRPSLLKTRIVEALHPRQGAKKSTEAHEQVAIVGISKPHVLVAEDNIVNQRVASKMLEKLGCTVDIADNGALAVDAVLKRRYAMVFMDCQMPQKDGYEATREIRRQEKGRHTPIVAMTASAMAGDREKALAAGMDDYLSKPVQLPDLRGALERWASGTDRESGGEDTEHVDLQAPSHLDVLDLTTVETLRSITTEEGSGLLADLVVRFEESATQQVGQLRTAAVKSDREALKMVAHSLKGSSGAIGAREVSAICRRIEDLATAPTLDTDALHDEIESLDSALRISLDTLQELAANDR